MASVDKLKRRPCICYYCGSKAKLSIEGGRLIGWAFWIGGSRCPLCKTKMKKEPQRRRNEYKFR